MVQPVRVTNSTGTDIGVATAANQATANQSLASMAADIASIKADLAAIRAILES